MVVKGGKLVWAVACVDELWEEVGRDWEVVVARDMDAKAAAMMTIATAMAATPYCAVCFAAILLRNINGRPA
jgi:hypothetical protein